MAKDTSKGKAKPAAQAGDTMAARLALVKAAGVPVNAADEKRITDSIAGAIKSLDAAVPGSIFDSEPANLDRLFAAEARRTKR